MAKMYLKPNTNLADVVTMKAADPSLEVVSTTGKPLSLQRIASLAFNPDQSAAGIANANAQLANILDQVNSSPTPLVLAPSASTVSALQSAANNQTVVPYSSSVLPSVTSLTPASNQVNAVNSSPTPLVLAPPASTVSALQSAANQATVVPVADTISAAAQAKAEQDAQTQREIAAVDAAQQAKDKEIRDYRAQLELEQKAAAEKAAQAKAEQDAQTQREIAAVDAAQQAKDKEIRDYRAQLELEQKAAANAKSDAELLATNWTSADIDSGAITPAELSRLRDLNTQTINANAAKNPQPQVLSIQDTPAELTDAQKAAALAAANTTNTKVTGDTLATLGGTANVADTGTVVDSTKLNTQGGGSALATSDVNKLTTTGTQALTTGDVNKLTTTGTQALATGDVNKLATAPAATSSANAMNTGNIPALTTADLASWGKTLSQGITADQLTAALKTQQDTLNKSYTDALAGNQTALTSQNADFLKNWNTSADALKNSILTGVDTKNQAFGTQATQGFMDAFKNFQIPTNQQTGVNLGNYNDNRNAAADQWWSQYVTGRR